MSQRLLDRETIQRIVTNSLAIDSLILRNSIDYTKALKCAILSQEIYQDFEQIQFSEFPDVTPELIDHAGTDTQCTILLDDRDDSLYIVFRGSNSPIDWDHNFDFEQDVVNFEREIIRDRVIQNQQQIYPYDQESRSRVRMHHGFSRCYLSIRPKIHNYLQHHTVSNVTVAGHSLGGALATLCAVDIQYNFSDRIAIDVYTFGAPKVGGDSFRKSFNRRVPNSYRFVYGMDIVPALPRIWQGYRHINTENRLGKRLSLKFISQRFKDHVITNYVTALKELAEQ